MMMSTRMVVWENDVQVQVVDVQWTVVVDNDDDDEDDDNVSDAVVVVLLYVE